MKRKTYWANRYAKIYKIQGLVYSKEKPNAKVKTISLKGKKLMRGQRLNSDEYLAICENSNPVKVLIKLTFKTDKERDQWGTVLFDLLNPQEPKAAPQK